MFEVPANSLIHIAILHGEAVWQHHRIDPVVLANIVKEPQVEEGIIQRVISLLMASVR